MTRVAGIDIARGAWLMVYLEDGEFVEASVVEDLSTADLDATIVAIDVPLDLPVDRIGRPAERLARELLGRRRSSVFPSLPLEAYVGEYTESTRRESRRRYGASFSKQSWNLRTAVLDARSVRDGSWFETHPELAFATIVGSPLESKKTWAGIRQRIDCLMSVGIEVPPILGDLHPDDALDAAVCAHVAWKLATGTAASVPPEGGVGAIWF